MTINQSSSSSSSTADEQETTSCSLEGSSSRVIESTSSQDYTPLSLTTRQIHELLQLDHDNGEEDRNDQCERIEKEKDDKCEVKATKEGCLARGIDTNTSDCLDESTGSRRCAGESRKDDRVATTKTSISSLSTTTVSGPALQHAPTTTAGTSTKTRQQSQQLSSSSHHSLPPVPPPVLQRARDQPGAFFAPGRMGSSSTTTRSSTNPSPDPQLDCQASSTSGTSVLSSVSQQHQPPLLVEATLVVAPTSNRRLQTKDNNKVSLTVAEPIDNNKRSSSRRQMAISCCSLMVLLVVVLMAVFIVPVFRTSNPVGVTVSTVDDKNNAPVVATTDADLWSERVQLLRQQASQLAYYSLAFGTGTTCHTQDEDDAALAVVVANPTFLFLQCGGDTMPSESVLLMIADDLETADRRTNGLGSGNYTNTATTRSHNQRQLQEDTMVSSGMRDAPVQSSSVSMSIYDNETCMRTSPSTFQCTIPWNHTESADASGSTTHTFLYGGERRWILACAGTNEEEVVLSVRTDLSFVSQCQEPLVESSSGHYGGTASKYMSIGQFCHNPSNHNNDDSWYLQSATQCEAGNSFPANDSLLYCEQSDTCVSETTSCSADDSNNCTPALCDILLRPMEQTSAGRDLSECILSLPSQNAAANVSTARLVQVADATYANRYHILQEIVVEPNHTAAALANETSNEEEIAEWDLLSQYRLQANFATVWGYASSACQDYAGPVLTIHCGDSVNSTSSSGGVAVFLDSYGADCTRMDNDILCINRYGHEESTVLFACGGNEESDLVGHVLLQPATNATLNCSTPSTSLVNTDEQQGTSSSITVLGGGMAEFVTMGRYCRDVDEEEDSQWLLDASDSDCESGRSHILSSNPDQSFCYDASVCSSTDSAVPFCTTEASTIHMMMMSSTSSSNSGLACSTPVNENALSRDMWALVGTDWALRESSFHESGLDFIQGILSVSISNVAVPPTDKEGTDMAGTNGYDEGGRRRLLRRTVAP